MKSHIIFLFALLALGIVHAQESGISEGLKAEVMKMQYEKAACRIGFYISVLGDIKAQGIGISVDGTISSLETHRDALKAAAYSGNREAFNGAAMALQADARNAVILHAELKNKIRGNDSIRQSLRESFNIHKKTETECIAGTAKSLGEAQSKYVHAWISSAQAAAKRLEEKGVDGTGMESVISEARGKITNFDSTVATGDADKIHEAIKEIRSEHLHLWARFHIARLNALLGTLESRARDAGQAGKSEEIKSLLDSAQGHVKPGKAYDEGEFQIVVNSLKEAVKQLRELVALIKQAK